MEFLDQSLCLHVVTIPVVTTPLTLFITLCDIFVYLSINSKDKQLF